MSDYLARREREALCDLALEVGPRAPTLCGDWTVHDLLTHLVVRERSILGAPGIVLPLLAPLTERSMARLKREEFTTLVERLRHRGLTPVALPLVDQLANTLEYVVHHEDIRRAQPKWRRRTLGQADETAVWKALRLAGKGLVRGAGVPVRIRRAGSNDEATLASGADPVVVDGAPVELAMFLFGRAQHRGLEFSGPEEKVARLRLARLGF